MEKSLILPSQPDPETFRRVWSRVMPDPGLSPVRPLPPEGKTAQTAHEVSPIPALLEDLARSAAACEREAGRGGPAARVLAQLSTAQRQSLRQLAALHYLKTGRTCTLRPGPEPPLPLPALVRREYLLCRRREALAALLETSEADPCGREFLRHFRAECGRWAALLWGVLEQFFLCS